MANSKIPVVALILILLLSLLSTISTPDPAAATPDEVKWSRVNIPTEGEAGNWVLANGSSVQHLTMAVDDTLYCYANPSGLRGHNNTFRVYSAGGLYSLTIKPYCDT